MIKSRDGRTLNDVAFNLLKARQWKRALPFARKAVRRAKSGTLTRAYATFNLGYALYELGRCRESLVPLRRALKLEPKWEGPYIRPWINRAKECVRRGAIVPAPSPSSGGQRVPSPAP